LRPKSYQVSVLSGVIFIFLFASPPAKATEFTFWKNLASEDQIFRQQELQYLPIGDHSASIQEFLANTPIVSNVDNGGLALGEDILVSNHAFSTKWQRYWLNANDMSHPLRAGQPLLQMPAKLWQTFTIRSLNHSYDSQHGTIFRTSPEQNRPSTIDTSLSFYQNLGGPTWMPANTFDREPAFLWGAPEQTRRWHPSFLGEISYHQASYHFFLESIYLQKSYFQHDTATESQRHTGSISWNSPDKINRVQAIFQFLSRDHLGLERGQDISDTLDTQNSSFLGQWQRSDQIFDGLVMQHSYLIGFSQEERKTSHNQIQRSLYDEVHFGPLQLPNQSTGISLDMLHQISPSAKKKRWQIQSRVRLESFQLKDNMQNISTTLSYLDQPLSVDLYDASQKINGQILHWRPRAQYNLFMNSIILETHLGVASAAALADGKPTLSQLSPTAQIRFQSQKRGSRWHFFAGLQHDAIPISSQELLFLHHNSLSGKRYAWSDSNSNGIYDSGEEQNILYRFGGPYHSRATGLKTAVMEELVMGTGVQLDTGWKLNIQGALRMYRNLYVVQYAPGYSDGYEQITRVDNIDSQILYDRTGGDVGQELYQLQNQKEPALYGDLEFQVIGEKILKVLYINFGLSMHYGQGKTVPGNGPEYNDIGVFNEITADPNQQIASMARLDYDRAFVGNLVIGFIPHPAVSLFHVLRYRDGEPLGRYIIAEGLTQGTIAVQTQERSQPPVGMPRYTYALTWDIRLLIQLRAQRLSIAFDVYNLLSSQTEIYEQTIYSPTYRDPVEAYPGRQFKAVIRYQYD